MASTPDIPNQELVDKKSNDEHSKISLNGEKVVENNDDVVVEEENVVDPDRSNIDQNLRPESSKSAAVEIESLKSLDSHTTLTDDDIDEEQQHPTFEFKTSSSKVRGSTRTSKSKMACEMCNNYEIQLQDVQYKEAVLSLQIGSHEKTIKQLREELRKEQNFRLELEDKYIDEAKKAEHEIKNLSVRVDDGQSLINDLTHKFDKLEKRDHDRCGKLIGQIESLKRALQRLSNDNEILLGKHLAKSQQLLSEEISLPQELNEMQFYCLKLREDLISAMILKEDTENQLKSENLFLKEQLRGEQLSVENFCQENDSLRTKLELCQMELLELEKKYQNSEQELRVAQEKFQENGTISDAKILQLEILNEELNIFKTKAESDLSQLRNKVSSLQTELDNSEAVQRDFVKLSQSLQVQLEKIRQSDTEVRWQHEDDATECNTCKKKFHSRKEKINCAHCGRIFCLDCCTKVIHSGPKRRPFKVCNVCHTLLDNQTACWFVNEAPQSPT